MIDELKEAEEWLVSAGSEGSSISRHRVTKALAYMLLHICKHGIGIREAPELEIEEERDTCYYCSRDIRDDEPLMTWNGQVICGDCDTKERIKPTAKGLDRLADDIKGGI